MRCRLLPIIGLVAILMSGCDDDLCRNQITREFGSPGGTDRAVVFERDCGATTNFSTQVSIMPTRNKLANKPGNIFAADGDVPLDSHGAMSVVVVWKNEHQVEVTYPAGARVYLQRPQFDDIRISYRPL